MNTKTNRPVRIKTAAKLRAELNGTVAHTEQQGPEAPPTETKPDAPAKPVKEKKAKVVKAPKPPKPEKAKRLSCIDAAAQVLKAAGKPMKAKEMIDAMAAQGLWTSPAGKTPEASLYAAIIREIAAKKKEARFKKHDRGLFVAE